MTCEARSFKIIHTGKDKRKFVAYFENWETLCTALETAQVFHLVGKELKWCKHSSPNLKKPPADTPKKIFINLSVDLNEKNQSIC